MKTIEINNKEGEVLFTHAEENNTIRKTLEAAVTSGAALEYANLQGANLQNANLQGANLQNANLSYANLSYANLQGANLQNANLSYANLSYADLRGADLQDANLQSASLWGADLSGARVRESDMPLLEKVVNLAKVQVVKPAHAKAPNKPSEDPPMKEKTELQSILSERASRYGDFKANAALAQFLKNTIDVRSEVIVYHPEKRQALHAIIDKMARILTGDPDYLDNWIDIQGYAKLISDDLQKDKK